MTVTFTQASEGYQAKVLGCRHITGLEIGHFNGIELEQDEQSVRINYADFSMIYEGTLANMLGVVDIMMDGPGQHKCTPTRTLHIFTSEEALRTWLLDDLIRSHGEMNPEAGISHLGDDIDEVMAIIAGEVAKKKHLQGSRRREGAPVD